MRCLLARMSVRVERSQAQIEQQERKNTGDV
jgi:hypothetical protein